MEWYVSTGKADLQDKVIGIKWRIPFTVIYIFFLVPRLLRLVLCTILEEAIPFAVDLRFYHISLQALVEVSFTIALVIIVMDMAEEHPSMRTVITQRLEGSVGGDPHVLLPTLRALLIAVGASISDPIIQVIRHVRFW
jgi:hypothetical protein